MHHTMKEICFTGVTANGKKLSRKKHLWAASVHDVILEDDPGLFSSLPRAQAEGFRSSHPDKRKDNHAIAIEM